METKTYALLAMGGTIAMKGNAGSAITPQTTASSLATELEHIGDFNIISQQICQKSSPSVSFDDVWLLVNAINELSAKGVAGFVVSHGTDTIEESAFMVDLLVDINKPIVFTGAMHSGDKSNSDGEANLKSAILLAGCLEASYAGVLLCFDGEIHAADKIYKSDTVLTTAFDSSFGGVLGRVIEGRVVWFNNFKKKSNLKLHKKPFANISVYYAALSDNAKTISNITQDADGLIIAGMGAGHVPESTVEALTEIVKKMPVVITSRISGGQVLQQTYGYKGGEIDLLERGMVSAGWLSIVKARILLALLISNNSSQAEIKQQFKYYDGN